MNPKELKEGKHLKAAQACSVIENIFKEKGILQQLNCKTGQWKVGFFQKTVSVGLSRVFRVLSRKTDQL